MPPRVQMWDVGGQKKIRMLWHHYFRGSHALIFVVDSNDRDRFDEGAWHAHPRPTPPACARAVLSAASAPACAPFDACRRSLLVLRARRAAREELSSILADEELTGVPVLVFANKQDLPKAAEPKVVADKMDMHKLKGREWHVQGCNATTGDGLYEGLDWLSTTLSKSRR
jgi:ADP-ribosylation factor protein 1